MSAEPISAQAVAANKGQTFYPEPLARQVAGRTKRKLADAFGLANFGVNLTTLDPGAVSALQHHHTEQDEFVYLVEGELTLRLDDREITMRAGDCMGFRAGSGEAHQLRNESGQPATYLEIGDRSPDDRVEYPNDDFAVTFRPGEGWAFTYKDGRPYPDS